MVWQSAQFQTHCSRSTPWTRTRRGRPPQTARSAGPYGGPLSPHDKAPLEKSGEIHTCLSSLYKSITFNKQCQQTRNFTKRKCYFFFTISYHNILLQHFQSRRAVGLKQCVHHFIKLRLFLSRNRIPVMGQAKLPVSIIVWMTQGNSPACRLLNQLCCHENRSWLYHDESCA